MNMNLKLFFLAIYSSILTDAEQWVVIIATETIDLFLFLDNLEQTASSYRGRNKIKNLKDILKRNFENILKMYKNHDANHCECIAHGSYKDNCANAQIKVINYTFSMLLFFREISDSNILVPMEVEEGGIEAYMVDFQGMLDGLDNPSEGKGEGVGARAGDDLVVRESNVMGRD